MGNLELNSDTQPVADGRFAIKERMGGGGLSMLFRAFDRELNQEVALKMLDQKGRGPSNEESSRRLLRFRREARILEELKDCPQVVKFIASDMEAQPPWIAMELLNGRTLRALIEDEPGEMSLPRFLLLADELVDGLISIHKERILHRDLSPDNVLVIRDEERHVHVRFLDFGIGKPLVEEESQAVTQMPTIMGRPQYIAPEQTRGVIGAGSDVYALGVMLYEILTGDLPIRISSFAEVARIRKEDPVPLAAHEASRRVPEELRSLIMACLAKESDGRPTLNELSECLKELRRRHDSGEDLATEFSEWEISRLNANLNNTRTILEPRVEVSHYRTDWLRSGQDGRELWLAKDTRDGKEVSLVIVDGSKEERAQFLESQRATQAIEHENVQRVFDCGETEKFAWSAREHIRGMTLKEVLEQGKQLPAGQILQIGQGVIDGLEALHQGGLSHGKLAPSFILLDEFDTVKLSDGAFPSNQLPVRCNTTTGAYGAWRSPEALLGKEATATSDLYSFGCLLFAMITTEPPFEGSDMAQAYQHSNVQASSVLDLRPEFEPRDLERIVAWTLNKDPDRRPQSAGRLREGFLKAFATNPEKPDAEPIETSEASAESKPSLISRLFRRG